ncbi:hypothetical protein CCAX7_43340 [Capsulimonas corticalis]|uniref:Uncharacterized protein n=1 Tax=Capsulimonas corticalis TaxID=2219043 RepID=A0A402CXG5_9BACT|nr:hypothetical protein [Capsulimonas corticalis]BDI32283.1 hypothetical protein CCAX7_43340 [Capsulimonas corticalis]
MTPEEEVLAAKLIAEYQDYHRSEREREEEKGMYILNRGMRDVLGVEPKLETDSIIYMECKFVPNGEEGIAIEYICTACGAAHVWPVYSSMDVGAFLIPERRAEIVAECPMPKD